MTPKQKFIPARANVDLIEVVNKQRKIHRLSWPALMETLLEHYIKNGLPQLDRGPIKAVTKSWTKKA